jgi:MFS superfamily sulfate permease-like transporter
VIATDSAALLELVWAAPLAAVAVTIAWGLVVWGSTRAADARRDGRTGLATLHLAVAVLGAALFTAAVVFGLVVMTSKD